MSKNLILKIHWTNKLSSIGHGEYKHQCIPNKCMSLWVSFVCTVHCKTAECSPQTAVSRAVWSWSGASPARPSPASWRGPLARPRRRSPCCILSPWCCLWSSILKERMTKSIKGKDVVRICGLMLQKRQQAFWLTVSVLQILHDEQNQKPKKKNLNGTEEKREVGYS